MLSRFYGRTQSCRPRSPTCSGRGYYGGASSLPQACTRPHQPTPSWLLLPAAATRVPSVKDTLSMLVLSTLQVEPEDASTARWRLPSEAEQRPRRSRRRRRGSSGGTGAGHGEGCLGHRCDQGGGWQRRDWRSGSREQRARRGVCGSNGTWRAREVGRLLSEHRRGRA